MIQQQSIHQNELKCKFFGCFNPSDSDDLRRISKAWALISPYLAQQPNKSVDVDRLILDKYPSPTDSLRQHFADTTGETCIDIPDRLDEEAWTDEYVLWLEEKVINSAHKEGDEG